MIKHSIVRINYYYFHSKISECLELLIFSKIVHDNEITIPELNIKIQITHSIRIKIYKENYERLSATEFVM